MICRMSISAVLIDQDLKQRGNANDDVLRDRSRF